MHAVDIDVVILYCRYFIAYDNESITYRKIPIFKDRVAKRLSKFHDTMLKLKRHFTSLLGSKVSNITLVLKNGFFC